VWSLELRQLLSYRVDFWIDFLGSLFVQIALAYFLWQAIYEFRGVEVIGGYSFSAMMLYYVLIPLVEKITRGQELGFLSRDIYEGTLNRYLVYPLSVFGYKYVHHAAIATLALLQLGLALGVYLLLFGLPGGVHLSVGTVLAGIAAAGVASVLYFLLAGCLALVVAQVTVSYQALRAASGDPVKALRYE